MADIQYINYGNQQIDQQVLLQNMANEVTNYVSNQPWSSKRKQKFMDAYTNLITHGIQGASNDTGVWTVNVGGDTIPLETMSKKDQEMYKEAAYFIQQQMSKLPTAESKKSDLPVFDNAYFTKNFANYVSTQQFGGRPFDTKTDWNSLDKRGDNGLRDRTNRSKILSDLLGRYADSLNENELSFEGSPFADLNDFKSRVERAKAALATTDNIDDDTEALNALGLRASDWFNNGSGDASNVVNPETGEYFTYGQLNAYNQLLAQQEQKALAVQQEQEKLAQQEQERLAKQKLAAKNKAAYDNKLFFVSRSGTFYGKLSRDTIEKYGSNEAAFNALKQHASKHLSELTPDKYSELYGAYKYRAGTSDPTELKNYLVPKELLNRIKSSSRVFANVAPNDLRMIPGINDLVYDTRTKKLYKIYDREGYEAYQAGKEPKFDLFRGVKTKESQEALERQKAKDRELFSSFKHIWGTVTGNKESLNNERYQDPDGSINWTNLFKDTAVDVLRGQALVEDVAASGAAIFVGGGTAISAALSIDGMLKEMAADIMDDGQEWGDVWKNLGINGIFTVVGLIPMAKLAKHMPKLAKAAKIVAPLVGTAISGTAAGALLANKEVRNSFSKIVDGNIDNFTSDDFRNVVLVLGAFAGLSTNYRATKTAIKGARASGSVKTMKEIPVENKTTGKAEKVKVTPEQLTELNKRGRSTGNKAAKDYLNEVIERTPANKEVVYDLPEGFNFKTGKVNNSVLNPVKKWTSPIIEGEKVPVELPRTQEQQFRYDKWREKSLKYKEKGLFKDSPTDFETYFGYESLKGGNQTTTPPNSSGGSSNNSTNNTPQQNVRKTLLNKLKERQSTKRSLSEKKDIREYKNLVNRIGLSDKELPVGTFEFGNTKVDISNPNPNTYLIKVGNKTIQTKTSLEKAREYLVKNFLSQVKPNEIIKDPESIKKLGDTIRGLKAQGIFKSGGRIDKQKIQKYKDFINK